MGEGERRMPPVPTAYVLPGKRGGDLEAFERWAKQGGLPQVERVRLAADGGEADSAASSLLREFERSGRTPAGRERRFLIGIDEGCREALRYALACPQLFGAVALLCPAFEVEGEVASWIEAYDGSPWQAPFYIVGGDGAEEQAAALYVALHRNPSRDIPAELRIVSGEAGEDVTLRGLQESLNWMLGLGESPDWAPRYEPDAYRPVRRGAVSTRRLQTGAAAGESLPSGCLTCRIYTPYGYSDWGERRYAVLYLLHGSGGTESSWEPFWPILDAMIERGRIPPVLAVAPVTGNGYWVDSARYGAVETAVARDLPSAIESMYPAVPARECRGLAGFSMGGYGALRYSLSYPDLFGGAVLLSPAVQDGEAPATSGAVRYGAFGTPFDPAGWYGKSYPAALPGFVEKGRSVPMYIVAGDDDWNHAAEREVLPEDAAKYNMEVQVVRLYRKLRGLNPAELRIVNGGHTMHVWAHGFEAGLRELFRRGALRSGAEIS